MAKEGSSVATDVQRSRSGAIFSDWSDLADILTSGWESDIPSKKLTTLWSENHSPKSWIVSFEALCARVLAGQI